MEHMAPKCEAVQPEDRILLFHASPLSKAHFTKIFTYAACISD